MPKRTNEFQELMALIEHSFARKDDKITSPAMVKVVGLETEREIDILHETAAGMFRIKVAIEAKDEGRPIDVTAFESYAAKYRGEGRVAVDKFVLVSRHGFTKAAKEKARLMDVPLLTLQEAKDFDWSALPQHSLFPRVKAFRFQGPPHICRIEYKPALEPKVELQASLEGRLICPHGHDHGTPREHFSRWLKTCPEEDKTWLKQLQELTLSRPDVRAVRRFSVAGYKLKLKDQEFSLEEILVHLHAVTKTAPLAATPYELTTQDGDTKVIQRLTAEVGNKVFELVMPDGLNATQISVRFKDKHTAKETAAQERKRKKDAGQERDKGD